MIRAEITKYDRRLPSVSCDVCGIRIADPGDALVRILRDGSVIVVHKNIGEFLCDVKCPGEDGRMQLDDFLACLCTNLRIDVDKVMKRAVNTM